MELENIEILNGILMIILCSISIYVGIKIISKSFKRKEIVYFYAGMFWILLFSPWYPGVLAFFSVIFTGERLTPELYMSINGILIPIAITLWIITFTEILYKEKQLLFVGIMILHLIVFYIIFFYLLFTNIEIIGVLKGAVDVQYGLIMVIYFISILIILLVTGIIFAVKSIKTDNFEAKLRGKLLFIAFILYVIGTVLDAAIAQNITTLLIMRLFEISSVFGFYFAFVMPEWFKKIVIKQN